jgi:hypothetical protein
MCAHIEKMAESVVLTPIPAQASKAKIHQFAEEVALRLGVRPGDPLEPVVAELGGRIVYKNPISEDGPPESIRVRSVSDFTIFLPTMTSPERDRFTIAHELGHFFLHYPIIQSTRPGAEMKATRWIDEKDPAQQRAEWEANWFAAAFLMPEKAFREAWSARASSGTAALRFGVSRQAAEVRASTLGLA